MGVLHPFFVGKFVSATNSEATLDRIDGTSRFGLNPKVRNTLSIEHIRAAAVSAGIQLDDRSLLPDLLANYGLFFESNYLVVDPFEVSSEGRKLVEYLLVEFSYDLINNTGRFCNSEEI